MYLLTEIWLIAVRAVLSTQKTSKDDENAKVHSVICQRFPRNAKRENKPCTLLSLPAELAFDLNLINFKQPSFSWSDFTRKGNHYYLLSVQTGRENHRVELRDEHQQNQILMKTSLR